MDRMIAISSLLQHVQVGLVEDGRLVEYYLERDVQDRLMNNIYQGRVENVLPGMDAAFVDIGLAKNAFLFLADLSPERAANLRKGDAVLVQVAKEAEGTKGPRVTTQITLPGRYLVLLPTQEGVGISRQITDEAERARLKELAQELLPEGMGLIVRTMAQNQELEELQEELERLIQEWSRIQRRFQGKSSAYLLYRDHDLIYRIVRDLYSPHHTKILVDSRALQRRVAKELQDLGLDTSSVELYEGKLSLFTYLGLDKDLERARSPRVWLDCGGYLVINQTEALLTIDVNTGKFVGGKDLQDTVLTTNLEAAAEIARQLRLRNVGGIVVVDFVHMAQEADREQVLQRLREMAARYPQMIREVRGLGLLAGEAVVGGIDPDLRRHVPARRHVGQRQLRIKNRSMGIHAVDKRRAYILVFPRKVRVLSHESRVGGVKIRFSRIQCQLRQELVGLFHRIVRIGLQRLVLLEIGRGAPPPAATVGDLPLLQELRL